MEIINPCRFIGLRRNGKWINVYECTFTNNPLTPLSTVNCGICKKKHPRSPPGEAKIDDPEKPGSMKTVKVCWPCIVELFKNEGYDFGKGPTPQRDISW